MRPLTFLLTLCAGCVGPAPEVVGRVQQETIYDSDDRVEYYEVSNTQIQSLVANSVVALVPRSELELVGNTVSLNCDTAGTAHNLCQGQRFADQPALAFCTGVLVDWDVVLTAYHCAHALALEDVVALFGYYYIAPGQLFQISQTDIVDIAQVIAEESGDVDSAERVDYALLQLSQPVDPPKSPVAVYVNAPQLTLNQPVISAGFGMGVPAKIDMGGKVRDLRSETLDYLIADTDTFGGSSGGGAFDNSLALLGVLARGGPDYVSSTQGCMTEVSLADGGAVAQEQYTYVNRAVAGLCQGSNNQSSLCRADCKNPCQALGKAQQQATAAGGSCTLAGTWGRRRRRSGTAPFGVVVALLALSRRRQRPTPRCAKQNANLAKFRTRL